MNDLPGRGDVNPYGIPMANPHERGDTEHERPTFSELANIVRAGNITGIDADYLADRLDEADRLREALRDIDTLASVPLHPDGPVGTLAAIRRLVHARLGDTPDE